MESYQNLDGDQYRDPSLAKAISPEPFVCEHKHVATKRLQHLSVEQQSSLAELSRMAHDRGLLAKSSGANEDDLDFGLSDEVTLMRFLRARSWDVCGALRQFESAMEIRHSHDPVAAYDVFRIDEFEDIRQLYPHWTGCRDKIGRPICIFDLSQLDQKRLQSYNSKSEASNSSNGGGKAETTQRALVFHDYLTRFVLPFCSMAQDRPENSSPIDSAVYLVDVSKISLKQAWSLRAYAQDISQLLATCYPEVITHVYILNAPFFFGKIWAFVKNWLDPKTAEKVVIVPHGDIEATLTSTIDAENLPVQFGGASRFEHGMTPRLDLGLRQMLQLESKDASALPPGPLKWTVTQQGGLNLTAVGAMQTQRRKEMIESRSLNISMD